MAENPSTTNPPVLLALAERCEREEPSRELECDIAEALGWHIQWHGGARYWLPGDMTKVDVLNARVCLAFPPRFSDSLDAAVGLVPADCWRETNGPRRYLHIPSPAPNHYHCEITIWGEGSDHHGWAATEPLAICAAALRARAALAKAEGR